MKVLAIDPGTSNFGWAVLDSDQVFYGAGNEKLSTDPSVFALEIAQLMYSLIDSFQPTHVVVEKQMRDIMIAVAQSAVTAALCRGIPARLMHPATCLSILNLAKLGHARNKQRNFHFVTAVLHYPVENHHEADALLLALSYSLNS